MPKKKQPRSRTKRPRQKHVGPGGSNSGTGEGHSLLFSVLALVVVVGAAAIAFQTVGNGPIQDPQTLQKEPDWISALKLSLAAPPKGPPDAPADTGNGTFEAAALLAADILAYYHPTKPSGSWPEALADQPPVKPRLDQLVLLSRAAQVDCTKDTVVTLGSGWWYWGAWWP